MDRAGDDGGVVIRLLGSLEVVGPDGPIEIRGAKRRSLVALLALRAPDPVNLDAIVGSLWGSDATDGARATVQTYISQLRRVLPDPVGIVTRGGAYGIDTPPELIDTAHFDHLVRTCRNLDAAGRLARIDTALTLWRGDPLTEFAGQPWADEHIRAFVQTYLTAQSLAIDALLELGHHTEALPRLERLVAAHPLDEGFWAQRMLACYRAGQQAAALRAYQDLRAVLAEELGIDPSPEITDLERRILQHDPTLALATDHGTPSVRPSPDALPDGVVTFVLTDIIDSTAMWDRHPREMAGALMEHEQLVDDIMRQHDGRMIKARGEGDSTFSVFARATDALEAAITLQRELRAEPTGPDLALHIRIGLHTGQAQLRDGDYYGGAINRAARVRGVAGSGEILLSRATHDLVADVLPTSVDLIEFGTHALKGLQRAETIYAVAHPDLAPVEGAPPTAAADRPRPDAPSDRPGTFVAPPEPVFGRAEEMAEVNVAIDAAFVGRGSTAVISGEPGIGKTRLAREVAATASERGATVWWGAGYEGDGAPAFWPIVQMLRSYAEALSPDALARQFETDAGDVLRFVPELADRMPGVRITTADDDGARFRQFDALGRLLRRIAGEHPVVIVFDDLQWADAASLSWLEFGVRALADAPVMFLATVRDTEPGGLDHLAGALGALARAPVSAQIALDGLDRVATAEHVAALTGTAPSAELLDSLVSRTAGNPFFLGEVVRFLESTDTTVPANVKAVIGRRLDQLSASAQTMLTFGAVAGREFDLGIIADAADLSVDEALDAAAEAADAHLVDDGTRRVRFVHALVRDTLLTSLRGARRVDVHRQVADATLRHRGDLADEHLDDLARLFGVVARAGDLDQALDYSLRAAARAESMLASETAVEHYERALHLLDLEPAAHVGQRAKILLAVGRLYTKLSNQDSARAALMQAATIGNDGQLVEAALRYRGVLLRAVSEDPDEVSLYERAIATQPSIELQARLHARAAIAARQHPTGRFHLEEASRLLHRSMSPEGQYDVLVAVVMSAGDSLPDASDRIAELLPSLPVEARADATVLAWCNAMTAGDGAAARTTADQLAALADEYGLVLFQAYSRSFCGALALVEGDLGAANQSMTDALALSDDQVVQFQWLSVTHTITRWRGDDPGGMVRSILESTLEAGLPPDAEAAIDIGLAVLALDDGDHERAVRLSAAYLSDDAMQRTGVMVDHVFAGLSEVAAATDDVEAAHFLQGFFIGRRTHDVRFVQSGSGAVLGPVAFYRGLALRTTGDLDASVDKLTEAIEHSREFGARPDAALAQVELAHSLLLRGSTGDHARAEQLLTEAGGVAAELGLGRVACVIDRVRSRTGSDHG